MPDQVRRSLADWLVHIEARHPKAIEMGLERVREVAARLRLPRPAKRVATVAGTNGKGSTVAFIEAIARAGGWRTGCYTSPHLLRYNERVRIDGREADDETLVAAFEAVEAARGDTPLTYFETGTLAALWLFAQGDAGGSLDLAVLEVGLGGRLDATNLVDPDVAVITTVDLDHQDWLGEDREAIGAEKAGIARAWTPLVLGEDDPPASVLRHAYAIGAPAIRAGCDYLFARDPDGAGWHWREPGFALQLPSPALDAPVQLRNAAAAIAALRALDAPFAPDAYAHGVAAAGAPARLQRIAHAGREVLVDAGHNPQAARALAEALGARPHGRTLAVYAALADKDHAGVALALADRVEAWFLAGSQAAGARGLGVDALAHALAGTPAVEGLRFADVREALVAALAQAGADDRVLVFGSFHAAAEALRALNADRGAGGAVR